MVLFFLILVAVTLSAVIYPRILVSPEFNARVTPVAFVVSLYVAGSFLFRIFLDKTLKNVERTKVNNLFAMVFILGCSWITFMGVISLPATVLHQIATKERVEIDVVVNSAWPSHRSLRPDCQYRAMFDSPKISSSVQSVCLRDFNQWIYFRDIKKPVSVTLYGEKSYFGYELKCCKQ